MPAPEEVDEAEELVMPITPAVTSLHAAMANILEGTSDEGNAQVNSAQNDPFSSNELESSHDLVIREVADPRSSFGILSLPRRSLRTVSPPRSPIERHRVVSVTTRTVSEAERRQVRNWYDAYLEEHFPQFDRAREDEEDLRWSEEQWNRAQPMQPTSTV